MTIEELIKQCDEVINSPVGQSISLLLPGTWGVKNTRHFGKGGPIGEIVAEDERGVIVLFNAREVKEYLLQLYAIEDQVKMEI